MRIHDTAKHAEAPLPRRTIMHKYAYKYLCRTEIYKYMYMSTWGFSKFPGFFSKSVMEFLISQNFNSLSQTAVL